MGWYWGCRTSQEDAFSASPTYATTVKLLSAALIASAVFASPALAAGSSVSRYSTAGSYASFAASGNCIRAPRIGALATAPWTDEAPCEPSTSF